LPCGKGLCHKNLATSEKKRDHKNLATSEKKRERFVLVFYHQGSEQPKILNKKTTHQGFSWR